LRKKYASGIERRRKKKLFGPVSGSSSVGVGVGVASTSLTGGGLALHEAFVGVF
jgi:hypothetical protein